MELPLLTNSIPFIWNFSIREREMEFDLCINFKQAKFSYFWPESDFDDTIIKWMFDEPNFFLNNCFLSVTKIDISIRFQFVFTLWTCRYITNYSKSLTTELFVIWFQILFDHKIRQQPLKRILIQNEYISKCCICWISFEHFYTESCSEQSKSSFPMT